MTKLTYENLVGENNLRIGVIGTKILVNYFKKEIELYYDHKGRVYTEDGTHVANLLNW